MKKITFFLDEIDGKIEKAVEKSKLAQWVFLAVVGGLLWFIAIVLLSL